MISKSMEKRLNEQLNVELSSAYLYLSMSAYCRSISMNGFANWMHVQAQEELTHAMKFYEYINDQHGRVTLLAVSQPLINFDSLLDVIEKTFAHEQHITALLNDLLGLALDKKDYATHVFLQWFITEQIEEEATAKDILESVKMVKDGGEGLLMLDRELGARKLAIADEGDS